MWQKPEIVKAAQQKGGWSSRSELGKAYNDIIEVLAEALKSGETVRIKGLGIFEPKIYKGHDGTNPKTGESLWVEDFAIVKFTPSPLIKPDIEALKKSESFSKNA